MKAFKKEFEYKAPRIRIEDIEALDLLCASFNADYPEMEDPGENI